MDAAQKEEELSEKVAVREGGFRYINPLLECASSDEDLNNQVSSFRDSVNAIIKREQDAGNVSSTSVLFQDLNGTQRFSILKDEEFIPASLMKLPIAMELLKLSEAHPEVMNQPLEFKTAFTFENKVQTIKPSEEITPGNTYTIDQLIQHTRFFQTTRPPRSCTPMRSPPSNKRDI